MDTNLPIGSIIPYVGPSSTFSTLKVSGWLLCDGSEITATDYPDLFTIIGNSFGGDPANFYLPDLRGMFLRGVDNGRSKDPDADKRYAQRANGNKGDNVGSVQDDAFKSHNHIYSSWTNDGSKVHSAGSGSDLPDVNNQNDTTSSLGGSETRPCNVYVYYIIYAGLSS